MLISICFSGMVFAWAPFLARWLGTCILLCIVAAVAKSCLFICICLCICEDNAFALTSHFGMGWNLWDCEGAVDLRVHTQASSPPLQNSARRPQCVPVLPSLERSFSLLKSETDSHTSYLSQTPQTCLCKNFLSGVNFSRLSEKMHIFDFFTRHF